MSILLGTPFMAHSMEKEIDNNKRGAPWELDRETLKVPRRDENQRQAPGTQANSMDSAPPVSLPHYALSSPFAPEGYGFPPYCWSMPIGYSQNPFPQFQLNDDMYANPFQVNPMALQFGNFEQYDFFAQEESVTKLTTITPPQNKNNQIQLQQTLNPEGKIVKEQLSGNIYYRKLMEILDITNWSNMDPGNNSCRNGKISFQQIGQHLGTDSSLYTLLYSIVHEDYEFLEDFSTSITENSISVNKKYVEDKIDRADKYLQNLENVNDQLKEEVRSIVFKVIALRLVKELRDKEFSFPIIKSTSAELQKEFEKLCHYKGGYQSIGKDDFIGNSKIHLKTGQIVSGYFMDNHRLKVPKMQRDTIQLSSMDIFNSFKLVGQLSSQLMDRYKNNYTILLDNTKIRNKLMRDAGASQFRPTYVKDLLEFLKEKKYNISKICELSVGWGDRLAGFLASINDYKITQYLGTDPNVELHPDYIRMAKSYTPAHYEACTAEDFPDYIDITYKHKNSELEILPFKARIYKKPAEDLKDSELKFEEHQADLMFTSIPNRNELYPDTNNTQSHARYSSYDEWKRGFLLPIIEQSVKAVRVGGIIAINTPPIHKGQKQGADADNIPLDLEKWLNKYDKNGIILSKVANFWYQGRQASNTLIYEVIRKEIEEEKETSVENDNKKDQTEEEFHTTDCHMFEESDDMFFY